MGVSARAVPRSAEVRPRRRRPRRCRRIWVGQGAFTRVYGLGAKGLLEEPSACAGQGFPGAGLLTLRPARERSALASASIEVYGAFGRVRLRFSVGYYVEVTGALPPLLRRTPDRGTICPPCHQ